jgi:hypothetical protein
MDLDKLKEKIEKLDKIHHIEILKIIIENDVNVNENINGIFINLTDINNPVLINKLEEYINNYEKQELHFQENETIKSNLETTFFVN